MLFPKSVKPMKPRPRMRYNAQIFQPFFAKKATIISITHTKNAEKVLVMTTAARLNQLAKAMCSVTETSSPPKIEAEILANLDQKCGVRYFGFAGIFRVQKLQSTSIAQKHLPKPYGSTTAADLKGQPDCP